MRLPRYGNMMLFKNSFKLFHSNLKASYSNMLGVRVEFKIIFPVIRFILFTTYGEFSSFMMNRLPGFKGATKHFRHHKAMFIDFATCIRHGIIRQIKFDITSLGRFFMEWLSSTFFSPCELPSTMITTACKKLTFCLSAIKIMHRNPSIQPATCASYKNGKPIISVPHSLVANRIPVDNRTRYLNQFIARWSLFSWLCHFISSLDIIIPYLKEQYNRRLCNAISIRAQL